jgi:hypothetical protein
MYLYLLPIYKGKNVSVVDRSSFGPSTRAFCFVVRFGRTGCVDFFLSRCP